MCLFQQEEGLEIIWLRIGSHLHTAVMFVYVSDLFRCLKLKNSRVILRNPLSQVYRFIFCFTVCGNITVLCMLLVSISMSSDFLIGWLIYILHWQSTHLP